MAVLSPSLNLQRLSRSANTSKRGLDNAGKSIKNIGQIIFKRTRVKREAYANLSTLKKKRYEDERRTQLEDELESPKTVTKPGGSSQLAQSDTSKGFLDRIIGFVGYLTAGWLMNNLPTWIGIGKEFIARIQKAGQIIGSFLRDTINIFTGSINVLGALGQNIISFDFFDTSKRLETSFNALHSSIGDMGSQLEAALGLVTTPLTQGKYSGQKIPGLGTQATGEGAYETQPPTGGAAGGGRWKPLLDLIHSVESSTDKRNNGYDAQNGAPGGVRPGLSQMTIGEIARTAPGASGRYQQMPQYLLGRAKAAGFNENTVFSPAVQDALAVKLIEGRGGNAWLAGKISTEQFMQGLANEWAALPNAYGQFSYSGQGSSLRPSQIKSSLSMIKKSSEVPTSQVASSGQQTLRSQGRGKIIEYLTGDRTSPNYRSDHAAGNYHDHLAFDSQETRDAAMRFLIGKGWSIGSVDTGRHAAGSYHYSHQAFDIPFYPNQSKKGVPDNSKGETALSSRLRADLIAGGFMGRGIGTGGASDAQIASSRQQMVPSAITPDRRGQDVIIAQPPSQQNIITSAGGGGDDGIGVSGASKFDMLNNFIKQKLLLDLAYL